MSLTGAQLPDQRDVHCISPVVHFYIPWAGGRIAPAVWGHHICVKGHSSLATGHSGQGTYSTGNKRTSVSRVTRVMRIAPADRLCCVEGHSLLWMWSWEDTVDILQEWMAFRAAAGLILPLELVKVVTKPTTIVTIDYMWRNTLLRQFCVKGTLTDICPWPEPEILRWRDCHHWEIHLWPELHRTVMTTAIITVCIHSSLEKLSEHSSVAWTNQKALRWRSNSFPVAWVEAHSRLTPSLAVS